MVSIKGLPLRHGNVLSKMIQEVLGRVDESSYQEVCLEFLRYCVALDCSCIEVVVECTSMASPPGPVSLKRMRVMEVCTVMADDGGGGNPQGQPLLPHFEYSYAYNFTMTDGILSE